MIIFLNLLVFSLCQQFNIILDGYQQICFGEVIDSHQILQGHISAENINYSLMIYDNESQVVFTKTLVEQNTRISYGSEHQEIIQICIKNNFESSQKFQFDLHKNVVEDEKIMFQDSKLAYVQYMESLVQQIDEQHNIQQEDKNLAKIGFFIKKTQIIYVISAVVTATLYYFIFKNILTKKKII